MCNPTLTCVFCAEDVVAFAQDLAFDPASSSTSQLVPCSSDKCLCGRPACGCSDRQECTYQRTYGAARVLAPGSLLDAPMQAGLACKCGGRQQQGQEAWLTGTWQSRYRSGGC